MRAAIATRSASCRRPAFPTCSSKAGPTRYASSCSGMRAGAARSRRRQVNAWFGVDVESSPARARARGEARAWRAASRRRRARVVRARRAAPAAACVACRAASRDRADGAGGARPLPAALARDRPARDAARGVDPAAGAGAAGVVVGVGGAPPPRSVVPAGAARPALRVGRARVGGRGPRPRRGVLPRGRAAARAAVGARRRRRARRTTRSALR